MKIFNKKILVGVCCYRHEIKSQTCLGLLDLARGGYENDLVFNTMLLQDCPYVDLGKSTIMGYFMSQTDADYLLIIDSDMGFSFDHVRTLLEANVDVISAVYPPRCFPIRPLTQPTSGVGLTRCTHVPGGFMLIKRSALARLEQHFQKHDIPKITLLHQVSYYHFCSMSADIAHRMAVGEDYTFCNNLAYAGVDIYSHFDVRVSHVGEYVFTLDQQTLAMNRVAQQFQAR